MREVVIIATHGQNKKSDVPRINVYQAVNALSVHSESNPHKKGFNLTDEAVYDILFNLPERFKGAKIRFIKDKSEVQPYDAKIVAKNKKLAKKVAQAKAPEPTPAPDVDLLSVNTAGMTSKEKIDYVNQLKAYAKEHGIKLHPATKNPDKIVNAIKLAQ